MKRLKFNKTEISLITKGQLNNTWRLYDDKNINLNDKIIVVQDKTGEIFGTITVKELIVKTIQDISDNDIANSTVYESMQDVLKKMNIFYNKNVRSSDIIKIIKFEYHNNSEDNVVEKSTYLTEVKLYADGGSRGNPGHSASGFVIEDMNGKVVTNRGIYLGITTNNQAEYQALKFGLEEAKKSHIQIVHIYMDSLLVVNQLKGIYKVRNRDLWPIYESIKEQIKGFKKVTIEHVPREFNKLADAEVNKALDSEL